MSYFEKIVPYLPTSVWALKIVWDNYGSTDLGGQDEIQENNARAILCNTALAVGGYFLTVRYAGRLGLNPSQVAALATLIQPQVPRMAVGGHCVFYGVKGAITAGKNHQIPALVKNVALIAAAYFANTPKMGHLVQYVYSKFNYKLPG